MSDPSHEIVPDRSPQQDGCTCQWATSRFRPFPTRDGDVVNLPTRGVLTRFDPRCPAAPHAAMWERPTDDINPF